MNNETDWCSLIWENRHYVKEIENLNYFLDSSYMWFAIGVILMTVAVLLFGFNAWQNAQLRKEIRDKLKDH